MTHLFKSEVNDKSKNLVNLGNKPGRYTHIKKKNNERDTDADDRQQYRQ